ncbi:AI-2E family transporter [Lactococcus garvieae]|nr:AI-2E family transporter [Lactococcus garvieae]
MEKQNLRASVFFKWFMNNKVVTVLLVVLLLLLNILLLNKVHFIFAPIGDFLAIVSLPVVLAAVFYYLLNPIVDYLEKKRVPRIVSIVVIFLLIAGLLVWGLAYAIPSVSNSVSVFSRHVPSYVEQIQEEVNKLLTNQHFEQFRPQMDDFMDSMGNNIVEWSKNYSSIAFNSITDVITRTASVFISLVIFPFVLFYLLRDGKNLNGYITHLLPVNWRKDTSKILTEMNGQLANYVRGQVIVALAVALMLAIGLPIIGLRYGITLAILSGIFNLIPFLGFYLAIIPAMIIGLATGGPMMLLKVLIVYIIEQTIEGRFVSPLVLGKQLSIHPVTVLFVLLTAGKVFGLWGVLLGVPFYAAAKVIISHFYDWYREISELYHPGGLGKTVEIQETEEN